MSKNLLQTKTFITLILSYCIVSVAPVVGKLMQSLPPSEQDLQGLGTGTLTLVLATKDLYGEGDFYTPNGLPGKDKPIPDLEDLLK